MNKVKCLYPKCGEYFRVNLTMEQIKAKPTMELECPFCRKISNFNKYNLKILNIMKGELLLFDEHALAPLEYPATASY